MNSRTYSNINNIIIDDHYCFPVVSLQWLQESGYKAPTQNNTLGHRQLNHHILTYRENTTSSYDNMTSAL